MSIGAILIRADASVSAGTGHVMRCLALAQAWQDRGGVAIFAMVEWTPGVVERLSNERFSIEFVHAETGSNQDAARSMELARRHGAKWVVLDGYSFGPDFQQALGTDGVRLLCVDDNAAAPSIAGLILNQNLHAREALYPNRSHKTELLPGPRYALIRREFASCKTPAREIPSFARRILVTMGGSDPQNLTARVIEALSRLSVRGLEVKVVVGGSNPRFAELTRLARVPIQFVHEARKMGELMQWADLAVASAGSTCWEICMLGLPAILIDAAENQLPLARELQRGKIARHIPFADATAAKIAGEIHGLMLSAGERSEMSRLGPELVDGKGASRVVTAMRSRDFRVRRAEQGDSRLLWEWANDPLVREASFSPEHISWDEHCHWFAEKGRDPRETILICEDDLRNSIGTVRFHETSPYDVEVGVTIAPEHRGQNYAPYVLRLALDYLLEASTAVRVHAFIKKSNAPSVRSFERVGFRHAGNESVRGNDALHYVLEPAPQDCSPQRATAGMTSETLSCK